MVSLARKHQLGWAVAVHELSGVHVPAAAALLASDRSLERTRAELSVEIERNLCEWPNLQLGAFAADGALLGVATGTIDEWDLTVGWSFDLVVDERQRHRGIGSALLEAQLEAFRDLGCERVRGQAPAHMFATLPFFQRHGFRVIQHLEALSERGLQDREEICITERVL